MRVENETVYEFFYMTQEIRSVEKGICPIAELYLVS